MTVAPAAALAPAHRPAKRPVDRRAVGLGLLAAAVVCAGLALGWRGVDLPAQLYRVDLFRRQGFVLWDSQWFGGHWLLDYSVLFPAVAASIGVGVVTVLSAAAATVAFDRLVVWHLAPGARLASVVFALGVAVQSSIGQLTFLGGEAAALWCLVAAARRRWWAAVPLALLATLASPLAGAFAALAVVTPWVAGTALFTASRRGGGVARWVLPAGGLRAARGPLAVLVAVAVPVAVTSLLFPGQGPMPYPVEDYLWELVVAAVVLAVTPRRARTLRVGVVLYALAATVSEAVPTPLGGNIGRLEDLVALPLAVALLWPRLLAAPRRSGGRWWTGRWAVLAVLVAVAVPLGVSQWSPAWAAMTSDPARPWTHAAYYRPLVAFLAQRPGPPGRTEVVPTLDHWETAYVAPAVPLARGWERQLDEADNPIFYSSRPLTAPAYRAWLLDNGVRWVALAVAAPLDGAGVAEGRVVRAGVPGLVPVWHTASWEVYEVLDSPGIVGPGATLTHLDGSHLAIRLTRPGTVTVRVRWSPDWRVVAGPAQVGEAPGRWLQVTASAPGPVRLGLDLL